jgi:hypothetical protein
MPKLRPVQKRAACAEIAISAKSTYFTNRQNRQKPETIAAAKI